MPPPFFQQAPRRRRPSQPGAARSDRRSRGVAMIIAIVSIAILTVVATDFAYNSRVDLQLAANQRDEVRAYYLARSGIGLGRLLLRFQKQADSFKLPPGISQMLQAFMGGGAPAQGGQTTPQPTSLNLQLWKMARVDCYMLQGLVKSDGAEGGEMEPLEAEEDDPNFKMDDGEQDPAAREMAAQMKQRSFGGFEGCFLATITDEEEKLNVYRLTSGASEQLATGLQLMNMLGDKRFEFLWERDDANKVRSTPQDVLLAMKDWADEDETGSAFAPTQPAAPFPSGFSDEGANYSRYDPSYEVKNSRFDSVDELYRVHGVNDQFMAAFRDRLTVYPDRNRKLNINSDDPVMLGLAIMAVADPVRPDPRLQDPVFINELITRIRTARMFSFFGMSVQDFVAVVQSAGVAVNSQFGTTNATSAGNLPLSDKTQTFTIKSVGEAGGVQKTLTAVVRLDDTLGKLVYWREE